MIQRHSRSLSYTFVSKPGDVIVPAGSVNRKLTFPHANSSL